MVMSGMVTQEKVETWMVGTEEPGNRRGRANEMLELWNKYINDTRLHARWTGMRDITASTGYLEAVEWYIMTRLAYRMVTVDIDEFIMFAGGDLIGYVADRTSMAFRLREFMDDRVASAAAMIIMVARKRGNVEMQGRMLYARFAYFLMDKDEEPVDVSSKRQVNRGFTRFKRFERDMDDGTFMGWLAEIVESIDEMKGEVVV